MKDLITDMSLTYEEDLEYPTQKPIELYERFIKASSYEDSLVLDPFCGCGTTIDAAHYRRWRHRLNKLWTQCASGWRIDMD